MDYKLDVTDVTYEEVNTEKERTYTISDISKKLDMTSVKLNHFIFKLNKIDNIFNTTKEFTEKDVELLELCKALSEDGMSVESIINYIKDDSNNLINPETGMQTRGMEETDIQVITRNATLEVRRQTDRIIDEMRNNISKELVGAFEVEAKKIAKISITTMDEVKKNMDGTMLHMSKEMTSLREDNQKQSQEIERLYNNQSRTLKKQLEERQKKIEDLERENRELKEKGLFNRLFKR